MGKKILVEWPILFFLLGNALFFSPANTFFRMQFHPHACFHSAWVTVSLPPGCWLSRAAQNAGNHVHKLLRVFFALLRECLPTNPSTKKHVGLSCSSTHAIRGAAREFSGAAMGFFLEDSGAWCIPDQEPRTLPEGPAHHAIANLQHRSIFCAHFWNFPQYAMVAIFYCYCCPCILQIIPDGQQGTSDPVSLFKLPLVSF